MISLTSIQARIMLLHVTQARKELQVQSVEGAKSWREELVLALIATVNPSRWTLPSNNDQGNEYQASRNHVFENLLCTGVLFKALLKVIVVLISRR